MKRVILVVVAIFLVGTVNVHAEEIDRQFFWEIYRDLVIAQEANSRYPLFDNAISLESFLKEIRHRLLECGKLIKREEDIRSNPSSIISTTESMIIEVMRNGNAVGVCIYTDGKILQKMEQTENYFLYAVDKWGGIFEEGATDEQIISRLKKEKNYSDSLIYEIVKSALGKFK